MPVQKGVVSPVDEPYQPGKHWPEHAAVVSPEAEPYLPVGQGVHAVAAPKLYVPAGHTPVQAEEAMAAVAPYVPGLQLAHDQEPAAPLYLPAGHAVHAAAPPILYFPAGHGPVQEGEAMVAATPYKPAMQTVHEPEPAML